MKRFWCLLGIVILLAVIFEVNEASPAPEPKRRTGGGSRSKSKGSSGSNSYPKQQYGNTGNTGYGNNNNNYGSKNNYGSNNNNYGSSGGYGKKKGKYSTLKKAAVIGAVAYGAYSLGRLSGGTSYGSGYGGWHGHPQGYGFNQWNRDREVDGFMCRKTEDCSWVDRRLYCQDYDLDFSPSRAWFGGDFVSIVGECSCPRGYYFHNREMYCKEKFFSGTLGMVVIAICVLIAMCCCCGCFYAAQKMRN